MGKKLFCKVAIATFLLLINFSNSVYAAAPFNCSNIEEGGYLFNLAELNKSNSQPYEKVTPPSITHTEYFINPCGELSLRNSSNPGDECPRHTWICEITSIKKGDLDIVWRVRQIAADDSSGSLNPVYKLGPAQNKDDGPGPLFLALHGGFYNEESQQANITFKCAHDGEKESIEVTNDVENLFEIEWTSRHACGTKKPDGSDGTKGRSTFSKFLIIIIIVGLTYLGVGAAYNHQVYGAQGWDLLPNRDFWREFPYLVADVLKWAYNGIRTGGRPGYVHM